MKTGKLIKELRAKKGMTQEELADKTEVSTRTIQRIENGEVDPRAYTLQMIARALEVECSLFTKQEEIDAEVQATSNSNWIALLHLSSLVPLIFPSVLIWKSKKNDVKNLAPHYKVVMTLQLMVLGVLLGCLWVYWKMDIVMPLLGALLANALFALFRTLHAFGKEDKSLNTNSIR